MVTESEISILLCDNSEQLADSEYFYSEYERWSTLSQLIKVYLINCTDRLTRMDW